MPEHSEHLIQMGIASKKQGDANKAADYFRAAIAADPQHADAYRLLATTLEILHQIEDARRVAATGLTISPLDPLLHLVAAKCEDRSGDAEAALQRLEQTVSRLNNDMMPLGTQAILFEYGRLLDRADRPSEAMKIFERANTVAARDWNLANPGPNRALARIRHQLDIIDGPWADQWKTTESPEDNPVFLIGFPRSGTTLLDQILNAHSGFHVMVEQLVIAQLEGALTRQGWLSPEAWPTLPEPVQMQARHQYWTRIRDTENYTGHRIFVDKMPLSITRLAFIHRLFPRAKVLFVLRHPLDACLSCFMQGFQLNPAMANFLTLAETGRFYAATMDLWKRCTDLLPIDYHIVRYEALVDNLECETLSLTEFLGVDWRPEMLEFFDHARKRGELKTPSYNQVTRPVYKSARYRWKRYAPYLEDLRVSLQPYIDAFGYEN